jgi:hypothetical protein
VQFSGEDIGEGQAVFLKYGLMASGRMRMPGDIVFIVFGAVPLVIASIKGYLGVREGAKAPRPSLTPAKLPV